MKKLIKASLISTTVLLLAINAWALPMTGDTVEMRTYWGHNYGMLVTDGVDSGKTFDAFCVEKNEHFSDSDSNPYGGPYWVESVGSVATYGGNPSGTPESISGLNIDGVTTNTKTGDPISQVSLWLYASFFEGVFNGIETGQNLVDIVQNAIWYEEKEINDITDYNKLIGFNTNNSKIEGWNIQVVNIVDPGSGAVRQSQLVGEQLPVPEAATMLLFGIGLIGLAGIGRKKLA